MTAKELEHLVEQALKVEMTPEDREAQRRSFVYGTTKLENKFVTVELVNEVGEDSREWPTAIVNRMDRN